MISEFAFIEKVKKIFNWEAEHPDLVKGIGDDCAVIKNGDKVLLFTTDILLEKVHFIKEKMTPGQLGHKALAVNLSDIAAMGGTPVAFYLTCAFTKETGADNVDGILEGMRALAKKYNVGLLGGDTSISYGPMVLNIAIQGEAPLAQTLMRHQARVGDVLILTGPCGDSAAGLQLLLQEQRPLAPALRQVLLQKHLCPDPQIAGGRLAAAQGCRAAIDISDGLVTDLSRITKAAGVGAELYQQKIPLSRPLRQFCREWGFDAWDLALHGGEDYELLLCAPPHKAERLVQLAQTQLGQTWYTVGKIIKEQRIYLHTEKGSQEVHGHGWEHFG